MSEQKQGQGIGEQVLADAVAHSAAVSYGPYVVPLYVNW